MRLTEGLHVTRIRRLKGLMWRGSGRDKSIKTGLFTETADALTWTPGSEGYEMWAAHTEALLRQRYMEKLSRGAGIDRTAAD